MTAARDENKFSTGFLKSLANTFKPTSNNSADKIDITQISDDFSHQELVGNIRSGSLSTRAKAAEIATHSLYEFKKSSILDIWRCARDLISPNVQSFARRAALELLIKCIELDNEQVASKITYYDDAIHNCHFSKSKIDNEFDLFLRVFRLISDNGTFTTLYQDEFKNPMAKMFFTALSTTEINKNKNLLEILKFLTECTNYGLLSNASQDPNKIDVRSILPLIIKLSLKTSDEAILKQCIQFINTIVTFDSVPNELMYGTLEVLCGAAVLNNEFYEQVCQIISTLINMTSIQKTFASLNDIILSKNTSEKNYNCSASAITILNSIFPSYASNINIIQLLESIDTAVSWNRDNIINATLKFIEITILNDIVINELNINCWNSLDLSVLTILKHCSNHLNTISNIDAFKRVIAKLQSLAESDKYPGDIALLIELFIYSSKYLTSLNISFVLKHYQANLLLHNNQSAIKWKDNSNLIFRKFFLDSSNSSQTRVATIELFQDIIDENISKLGKSPATDEDIKNDLVFYMSLIFQNLDSENNEKVLTQLNKNFIDLSNRLPVDLFNFIMSNFIEPSILPAKRHSSLASSGSDNNSLSTRSRFTNESSILILKSMISIFAQNLFLNGEKSAYIYDLFIKLAENLINKKDCVEMLLIVLRLFVRIRASANNEIYLSNPIDIDGLSAAFERNLNLKKMEDDQSELWYYPELVDYIPNDCLDKPSTKLKLFNPSENSLSLTPTIDIDRWLTIVIQILGSCPNYEIYSFLWCYFCPQLANLKLFENCSSNISSLRSLACDQLSLRLPSSLKFPEQITKSDLQVAIVRNFTPIISYHRFFSKQDHDQIISSLLNCLTSGEKTTIPCVHILTICCYEIPLSIKKFLTVILTKLQTRISSPLATAHILEFLLSLSYIPDLTSNFTVDDFKRAIGMTFKIIQYSHDIQKIKDNQHRGVLTHGQELEADKLPSTELVEITPVISSYLLYMSYDIIANWYLNMKINERRKLTSFIIRNLILEENSNSNGSGDKLELSNQKLAFIDLIQRFTYSNLELSFSPITTANSTLESDDPNTEILSSKWVYGTSIFAIDTNSITGESKVVIRRSSGTTIFKITPDESMIPYYTNQLHSSQNGEDVLFTDNYMFMQLFVQHDPNQLGIKPIPIPNDESINRSITNFDRIPVVEFHKIGLMYIGPNQTTEQEIFTNDKGSDSYNKFLEKFGRKIKLKNCKSFYVGGLDTENDADGEYAYGWNDKVSQMIYHTTTIMPRCKEDDSSFSSKKRHVGNNYVNVFFNESGQTFDFNIIKTQFNFLNIVIEPHSISFGSGGHDNIISSNAGSKQYKVKVYRRSGVPALFATCHFKIISEENLPTFIRTLAIECDQFAQVWHTNGAVNTNGAMRMKQINSIKERCVKNYQELKTSKQKNQSKPQQTSSTTSSFFEQLSSTSSNEGGDGSQESNENGLSRKGSINRRTSNTNQYDFYDEDENKIFTNLEFTSFTK